jgi:hypothetical protein
MIPQLLALVLLAQPTFPASSPTLEGLVPRSCRLVDKVEGDLDGDGAADAALRLACAPAGTELAKVCSPSNAAEGCVDPGEHDQVLLLALKRGDHFERVAVSERILICSGCGGALSQGPFQPAIQIEIKKAVVVISQLHGSREARSTTHRFRWDKAARRFVLIGLDDEHFDRAVGTRDSVSTNFLTGQQIIEKTVAIDDCEDADREKCLKTSKNSRKVPATAPPFDAVKVD